MPNQVTIDKQGIIRSVMDGDQDEQTINQLSEHTLVIVRDLQAKDPNARLLFLVDMKSIGSQTLGAREVGFKQLKNLPYTKIAITGANRFIKNVVSLIISASGQEDKVRQFDDQAQAVKWLLEK